MQIGSKIRMLLIASVFAGTPGISSALSTSGDVLVWAAQQTVTGTVKDVTTGEPLSGASIRVKNSSVETSSGNDGQYRLDRVAANDVLTVSYVGYKSIEIRVGGRDVIDITLESNAAMLEDVVVVGYGTQSRNKITGAITQVGAEVFQNRPIVNIAQGLQGVIPNLNITFGDGQLNRGGSFNLRGFTSINGGEPLILIDGTPGDINLVNPEDVERVSVLKDAASAAIYGARAAFGVVLVTTKSGRKDHTQVRYTNNFGIGTPIRIPQVIGDPLEAAIVQNDAYRGYAGTDAPDMQNIINYLRQRQEDPSLPELGVTSTGSFIRGANTDWYGEFYNDNAPFSKNYLSISGGQGNTGYYLSMGHEKQHGLFRTATDDYTRYSLRLKLDNQLADWIKVYDNVEYNQGVYDSPNKFVSEGGYNVYRYLSLYANPYEAIRTANGNYTLGGMSVFGQLNDAGRTNDRSTQLKNTLGFQTNFFGNHLRINGDYTYFLTQGREDIQYFRMQYEQRQNVVVDFTNPDYYRSAFSENHHHIANLYTEYEEQLGDHHFKGLLGYNQEFNRFNSFYARRDENITESLGAISLTNGIATLGDKKYEWALQGVFTRLNYDYRNKYLLEVNARYDGTSRFEQSRRFGFFPSVSLGWVVSEEDFFQSLSSSINLFKFRASYGSLGNQLVGPYAYISTMTPYITADLLEVGGSLPSGVRAPALLPNSLTWETANTVNAGFDLAMLHNRFELGFDWYIRQTKNMLTKGRTMPAVLGTAEPRENAADLETKGWEFSLKWNDQVTLVDKPFSYHALLVLSDNRSFITRYDNPNKLLNDYYVGQEIGEIWGYTTLGFFQTDEESASHADQSRLHLFPGLPLAGDIKFEDRDNSGVIDFGANTVDDPGDMHIIGNTTPRYAYGVNLGFNWYNFSVDAFFQGIGKRYFWPGREAGIFWGFYNRWNQPVYEHIYGNYWTPENPDAYFPRLRAYEALATDRSLGAVQTRYLQDASYLRLKNLSLGYTLPSRLTERVKIASARVFFAGQNLYEWTKLSKAFDPEGINDEQDDSRANGAGFVYPMMRTYTFGIEINL